MGPNLDTVVPSSYLGFLASAQILLDTIPTRRYDSQSHFMGFSSALTRVVLIWIANGYMVKCHFTAFWIGPDESSAHVDADGIVGEIV